MHSPADSILRAGKSLAVHIVVGLVLYGLAIVLVGTFDAASDAVREQYEESDVMQMLTTTRGTIVGWYVMALIVSWALSAVFLVLANFKRAGVRVTADGRNAMAIWIALFVLTLGGITFSWWRQVSLAEVAAMLLNDKYLTLVTAGYVGIVFAFWLGTGLAVALTLKPSVPMAQTLLPQFWN